MGIGFKVLYNSLKQMLEYSESDLEEVFMQTFRISYQDVFGSTIDYDLKDRGDSISVTQENKYVSIIPRNYIYFFYLLVGMKTVKHFKYNLTFGNLKMTRYWSFEQDLLRTQMTQIL